MPNFASVFCSRLGECAPRSAVCGAGGKVKTGAGCIAQGPTPFRQGPTLFFQQLFRLLLQAVRLVYRPASADAQQLDVENQGGVARYGAAGARAVA